MASVVQYPAINARIRAITGKMLNDEDYKALINFTTVQEIFNYLYNNTYYHDKLGELSGLDVHRRRLELILKKSFLEDYLTISRYLRSSSKEFFQHLFKKFEIEDLKMLLRTMLIEHDEDYFTDSLIYLDVNSKIDIQKLTSIESFQDLLAIFKETEYYGVLKRFADNYEQDRNLFPIEMSLDLQYFSKLEKLGRKTGKNDYKYIEELVGAQVDLLNIQWIYRIKKYYSLSSTEILNYIIPFHYKVSREDFKKMSQVDEPSNILNFIPYKRYRDLFEKATTNNNDIFEKYFLSFLLNKSLKVKSLSFFSIGNIIAYLFIKEHEIRDIITIVEGVRYSLNVDKLKEYMIRDGV